MLQIVLINLSYVPLKNESVHRSGSCYAFLLDEQMKLGTIVSSFSGNHLMIKSANVLAPTETLEIITLMTSLKRPLRRCCCCWSLVLCLRTNKIKRTLRKSFVNAGKCGFNVIVKPSELNMMCSGESSLNVNKPATASIEDSAGWLEIEVI